MIDRAIIFAAGRGRRMRHLSENVPKPMLNVAGKSIIKRLLDKTAEAHLAEVVVNTHYMGDKVKDHLKDVQFPRVHISEEETLLETGGGAKKVLSFFQDKPFMTFNGDMLWTDGQVPMIDRMRRAWKPEKMDLLLLLHRKDNIPGFFGTGDYFLRSDKSIVHCGERADAPYVFAGATICKPELFDGIEDDAFGYFRIFKKAEEEGRIFGLVHDGDWFHLSTPEMLLETEKVFLQKKIA